ncbi:unnamed protein product, partial [Mycena citricolor]
MSAVLHSFCCCCCSNTAWQHADPCLISRARVAAQALHFIHSVGYICYVLKRGIFADRWLVNCWASSTLGHSDDKLTAAHLNVKMRDCHPYLVFIAACNASIRPNSGRVEMSHVTALAPCDEMCRPSLRETGYSIPGTSTATRAEMTTAQSCLWRRLPIVRPSFSSDPLVRGL